MYLKIQNIFSHIFRMVIAALIILVISSLLAKMLIINHQLGIMYYNWLNLPSDFPTSLLNSDAVVQVSVILSFVELCLIIFVINKVKKIEIVRKMLTKIYNI